MLSINGSVKIFIATDPIDCRKSHDALAALAEHVLRENPLSGNLFLFINKRAWYRRFLQTTECLRLSLLQVACQTRSGTTPRLS